MSQTFNIKEPTVEALRFVAQIGVMELTQFVGDLGMVMFQGDEVAISFGGPYNEEDFVVLEEDDRLVKIFDEIEVFSAEAFEQYFE